MKGALQDEKGGFKLDERQASLMNGALQNKKGSFKLDDWGASND